jgi:hypothetical protein
MYRDIENIIETEIRPRLHAQAATSSCLGSGTAERCGYGSLEKCVSESVGH